MYIVYIKNRYCNVVYIKYCNVVYIKYCNVIYIKYCNILYTLYSIKDCNVHCTDKCRTRIRIRRDLLATEDECWMSAGLQPLFWLLSFAVHIK